MIFQKIISNYLKDEKVILSTFISIRYLNMIKSIKTCNSI